MARAVGALKVSLLLTIGFTLTVACKGNATVKSGDPRLSFSNGRWLLDGKPFTGDMVEALPDATRVTHYVSGAEDGEQKAIGPNGGLIEQRFYKEGKKHGVHRGWFEDGADRFYTEFDEDRYSGEHWTWYANGKVAEFKKYTSDGQIMVHKHWRESGQIYRNQVFAVAKNQEAGMPGVKLCNTVKATVGNR